MPLTMRSKLPVTDLLTSSGQVSPHRYTKDVGTLPFSTGDAKFFAEKFLVRAEVLPLPCGIAYEAGQT
jgi:hypothetical protein